MLRATGRLMVPVQECHPCAELINHQATVGFSSSGGSACSSWCSRKRLFVSLQSSPGQRFEGGEEAFAGGFAAAEASVCVGWFCPPPHASVLHSPTVSVKHSATILHSDRWQDPLQGCGATFFAPNLPEMRRLLPFPSG